jgi:intraflagellar transport protein 172
LFDALWCAQAVGQESEAFVFLNHYLDLCEAIEEGNVDLLDYSDFTNTDFPMEIPLPASLHISPQQQEEVKEWVLAISIDQKVDQVGVRMHVRKMYQKILTN